MISRRNLIRAGLTAPLLLPPFHMAKAQWNSRDCGWGISTIPGCGNSQVFPGDIGGPWTGIYGVVPMTLAYYQLSFTGSTAAKAFSYTRIDNTGSVVDTGSIYFVNGKIDIAALQALFVYQNDSGPVVPNSISQFTPFPNPYYSTRQVRITGWSDHSGNGNDLSQGTLASCPALGIYQGQLYVFFTSHYLQATLASGSRLSTTGFTMVATCKPFCSYNSFGGTLFYGDVFTGSQSLGLINNTNGGGGDTTSFTHWGAVNTLLATPLKRAGLSSIRRATASLTQSLTQTCEIGIGTATTQYSDFTGGTFTGTGITLGSAPGNSGGFFSGGVQGFMFAGAGAGGTSAYKTPAVMAIVRAAMDAVFSVPAINETKNIVITGFSNNVGFSGYGIPQIKAWGGNTGNPPIVAGWGQQLSDAISPYRTMIVANQIGSDFWPELTARIPDVIAAYSGSATTNTQYFSPVDYAASTSDPSPTAATYISHLTTYINAFNTAATGQTWRMYCGGFSFVQDQGVGTPTSASLNAALANPANGNGTLYTYVPTVDSVTYLAAYNNATAGGTPGTGDEWRQVDNHLTMISSSAIAYQEGLNLNALL